MHQSQLDQAVLRILAKGKPKGAQEAVRAYAKTDQSIIPGLREALGKTLKDHPRKQLIIEAALGELETLEKAALPPIDQMVNIVAELFGLNQESQSHVKSELEGLQRPTFDDGKRFEGLNLRWPTIFGYVANSSVTAAKLKATIGSLSKIADSDSDQVDTEDRYRAGCLASILVTPILKEATFSELLGWTRWLSRRNRAHHKQHTATIYHRIEEIAKNGRPITGLFDEWLNYYIHHNQPNIEIVNLIPLAGLLNTAGEDLTKVVALADHWSNSVYNPTAGYQAGAALILLYACVDELTSVAPIDTPEYSALYIFFGQMFEYLVNNWHRPEGWGVAITLKRFLYHYTDERCVGFLNILRNCIFSSERLAQSQERLANLVNQLLISVKGQEQSEIWRKVIYARNEDEIGRYIEENVQFDNRSDLVVHQENGRILILTPDDTVAFVNELKHYVKGDHQAWLSRHRDILMSFAAQLLTGWNHVSGLKNRRRYTSPQGDTYVVSPVNAAGQWLSHIFFAPGQTRSELVRTKLIFQGHTLLPYTILIDHQTVGEDEEDWVLPENDPLTQSFHGLIFLLTALCHVYDSLVADRASGQIRPIARRRHPQTGGPAHRMRMCNGTLSVQSRAYWVALPRTKSGRLKAMTARKIDEILKKPGGFLPDPPTNRFKTHIAWPPGGQDRWIEEVYNGKVIRRPVGWAYVADGRLVAIRRPRVNTIYPKFVLVQGQSALEQLDRLLDLLQVNTLNPPD